MRSLPHLLLLALAPLLLCHCSTLSESHATTEPGEYIMLVGGPSLRHWEDLRRPGEQHDRFWGNFVSASNRRADQLKAEGRLANRRLTYLAYRPGLAARGREDGKPYLQWAEENAAKRGGHVVWFDNRDQLVTYLNGGRNRRVEPIIGLEYFGHSNRHCLMFDYGSNLYAASDVYLHEVDLRRLDRGAFAHHAYVKSWGCHSGESMSDVFRGATGQSMIGAIGATDYTYLSFGQMPQAPRWYQP